MKLKFSRDYQKALLSYLAHNDSEHLLPARGMGERALAAGLHILDLAKLHEQVLISKMLPSVAINKRSSLIKRAGAFFTEAITPIERTHRTTREAAVHLNEIVEMLSQRTVELAASNVELQQEIVQRKAVETALKKSEHHYSKLLEQSESLQEQLRQLSRQILATQEEERREISRELHDVIAQTLTSINVRLAALKKEAAVNTKDLDRNIARTQKLVEHSVDIVHQFARELRPAVLDDLGLTPALHSFVKAFSKRTNIPVQLKVFARVEQLDINRRTVLFRVAQEALTNVSRHARAKSAELYIYSLPGRVGMKISDDGKSFHVKRVMQGYGGQRLGLLGMRERVEMVGGTFCIESKAGVGTSILVEIPLADRPRGTPKKLKSNNALKKELIIK